MFGLPVSPAQLSQLSQALPTPDQLNDVLGILRQVRERMLQPADPRVQSIQAVENFASQVGQMAGVIATQEPQPSYPQGEPAAAAVGQPAQPTVQSPAEPAGPTAALLSAQPPAATAAVPANGQQTPQERVCILVDQDTGQQYQMRASDYTTVLGSGHVFVTPNGGKLRVLQSDPLADAESKLVAAGADERVLGGEPPS